MNDLEEAARYIAQDSARYAATFVREALDAGRSLSALAERGRLVPEIASNNIREIFLHRYRLIYQVSPERVAILGLIHGARDLSRLWREEDRKTNGGEE